MAQKLLRKGYKEVFALRGGWDAWVAAEYPLEKRDPLPGEEGAEEPEASPGDEEEPEPSESDDEAETGSEESSETKDK